MNLKTDVMFLSKIGDTYIDIPDANLIIQVSATTDSKRQEVKDLKKNIASKFK